MPVSETLASNNITKFSDIQSVDLAKMNENTLTVLTTLLFEAAKRSGFTVPPPIYCTILPILSKRDLIQALVLSKNENLEIGFNYLLEIEREIDEAYHQFCDKWLKDGPPKDECLLPRSSSDADLQKKIRFLGRHELEKIAENFKMETRKKASELVEQILTRSVDDCAKAFRESLPEMFMDPTSVKECFSISDFDPFIAQLVDDSDVEFWSAFCAELGIPHFKEQRRPPLLIAYEGVITVEEGARALRKSLPKAHGYKTAS